MVHRSVPNTKSALEASRAYANHPHLAGSPEDFSDAKTFLRFLQDELDIPKPEHLPIYKAGSEESRNATLLLADRHGPHGPTAWIDTYYPVMNRGINQELEILDEDGEVEWTAGLQEDGDPGDADAHKYRLAVPPFHGYGADGDVSGQLVYANYGLKEDYDELVAQGVNLTGKIIIARYGGLYVSLQIKRAEELGAVGVLLYSDVRDDGFVTTSNGYLPYPAGPARNPTAIERGSVQYISSYVGDPTTPGYPAYEEADRVEAANIPRIPSLPISWANAQRLIGEIGDVYSVDEIGRKVLSGRASTKNVRLVNRVDVKVMPIWNTMAAIPGHIKNEVVILGCHRDAWVMGAVDPLSGTVALHEVIRGFGALLRQGWKPLRTIIIASWDAEEYGIIGSTEWAEDFSSWISENVVSYLNLDNSVTGSMFISAASPSLAHVIKGAAQEISHPNVAGKTLWDAMNDEGPFKGALATSKLNVSIIDPEYLRMYDTAQMERKSSDTGVFALGSGTDHTAFLQRLGVASSVTGFVRTPSDAVYHYHSVYDTQAWQERYGDVGFRKTVAIAQHFGLIALRLVDSIVVPLNTTQYALELDDYLARVEELLTSAQQDAVLKPLRRSIRHVQQASMALDEEKAQAEEDFKKLLSRLPWRGGGTRNVSTRVMNLMKIVFGVSPPTPIQMGHQQDGDEHSWLQYLDETIDGVEAERAIMEQMDDNADFLPFTIRRFIEAAKRVGRVNKKLMKFERGFISEDGIKDREWYKHLGVAPGKWLGYGATTFPALTEAITIEKDDALIGYEVRRLEELLDGLAEMMKP
ncbi:hypothetical protein BJ165DRAFT_1338917 [Panaeolus papilionaceus]|nr:hypothetical protein BJ165DRAFT_1338917 [Panaeolus papilionaceus]